MKRKVMQGEAPSRNFSQLLTSTPLSTMTLTFGLAGVAALGAQRLAPQALPRSLSRVRPGHQPARPAACSVRALASSGYSDEYGAEDGHQRAVFDDSRTVYSLQNPRVKTARALLKRRARSKDSRMLVEGHRLVLDAVESGARPELLFYTAAALDRGQQGQRLRDVIDKPQGQVAETPILVTPEVMEYISDTVTPQGVVAVLAQPSLPFPENSSLVRCSSFSCIHR
jgi:RNA 2'-O ribose methyltransferase substrate binding